MKQQWERLEAWLKANDPALLADLNPPASDADIQELEQKIGAKLPADFIECLKVHNGQGGKAVWLFDGNEFLSTRNILMSWSVWTDLLEDGDFDSRVSSPDDGIQSEWWTKGWIPFATNGGGDYLCLDLTPSEGGCFGQVIKVFHDFPKRALVSASFSEWIEGFLKNKLT